MTTRRALLSTVTLAGAALAFATRPARAADDPALSPMPQGDFPVKRAEAEWRSMLTEIEFMVLRRGATVAEWSYDGWKDYTPGRLACRGCGQELFDNAWKFDAKIGWPNFHTAEQGSLDWIWDHSAPGFPRRALHCTRCGSHHGHLFLDGPTAARTRFCMNDPAMVFTPAS